MADDPKTLVSTEWLAAHLKDPDLRIFDASWYMPAMKRNARAEYETGHIPGARFFDIDEISDQRSELPHMVQDLPAGGSRLEQRTTGYLATIVGGEITYRNGVATRTCTAWGTRFSSFSTIIPPRES